VDRVRLKALAIGSCLSVLVAATGFVPIVWDWEEGIDLQVLFRARGPRAVPDGVVLVPIDRKAARSIFLPQSADEFERCRDVRVHEAPAGYRNPDPPDVLTRWPRCLHARVLEALAPAQPDVVVMDISFRPRSDPGGVFSEQDRQLASAMRKAGNVVLAVKITGGSNAREQAQPIAAEIKAAAVALAPFLLLGDQLQRADKYCTFKEGGDWTGPCLPAVALQAASLAVYPQLRDLLRRATVRDADLIPAHADALLADGALRPSVMLMRNIATSDRDTAVRVRAQLAARRSLGSGTLQQRLTRLGDVYVGAGIRYLNFYGPPGGFPVLRYEALLAGSEPQLAFGSLRGKAVFIGFAEYEQAEPSDHFTTPFTTRESIKLSGVELAATAYANLLDGSDIATASQWQRASIALSLGVLCTLLFAFTPLPVASTTCLLLWIAYFGAALAVFKYNALWLPMLVPLGFSIPLAAGSGLYFEISRQRDRTRRALGALLPARLVERIIDRNEELAQLRETVYGSCVFTDMHRYTALFKDHSPDEVARILDSYFQTLFPVVQEVGGETVDVLGDAMLAIWAGAEPDPALRERACMAALQLAAAAERFRKVESGAPIRTRIGVDFGQMSLGMLGSALHFEYRPTGEPPNIASRLQELGKEDWLDTQLLASEAAISGLDRFLVRDLGLYALRNLPHPTRVYELMGERANATRAALNLSASFANALAAYQAGRYVDARIKLEQMLRDHPGGDGPTRYYWRLCTEGRHYGAAPIPVAGDPQFK